MKTSIKIFLLLSIIFVSGEIKAQVKPNRDTATQHKRERDSINKVKNRTPRKDTTVPDKTKVNPRIRKDSVDVGKGLPPKKESASSSQNQYKQIVFLLPGKNSPLQSGSSCF